MISDTVKHPSEFESFEDVRAWILHDLSKMDYVRDVRVRSDLMVMVNGEESGIGIDVAGLPGEDFEDQPWWKGTVPGDDELYARTHGSSSIWTWWAAGSREFVLEPFFYRLHHRTDTSVEQPSDHGFSRAPLAQVYVIGLRQASLL